MAGADLPRSAGHPFYERLNGILEAGGFDELVESECAQFYAERMGRPSLSPGRYFRLLLVGYFEGLDSERGMAWRAQDSLSIRRFLGLGVTESAPDHSTISRTRRLVDVETHSRVFSWVLGRLAESGLVSGKTVGMDATTLEANAALRSIVRLDSGEDYDEFVRGLAEASGVETPTRTELVRFDRKRKKKLSNAEWANPHDPDAEITKMKDGRTHFAYKAEQAVDLESGTILGVTVQGGSKGDTESFGETLEETFEQVESATGDDAAIQEIVADKGYHSNAVLASIDELGLRSYIAEPPGPRFGSPQRPRRSTWRGLAATRRAIPADLPEPARKTDPLAIQHLPPRLVPSRTTHLTGPPPRATKPLLPRAARSLGRRTVRSPSKVGPGRTSAACVFFVPHYLLCYALVIDHHADTALSTGRRQRTGMGIYASVLPALGLLHGLGDNLRLDLKEIANYGSSQFTEKLPMH